MKNAITYTISLKEYMHRAILVAVLFAIAPFYDDHTKRFITARILKIRLNLLAARTVCYRAPLEMSCRNRRAMIGRGVFLTV